MKVKEWFRKLIAGMAIGAGAAIPGVSGAAIAVIFHVYEDIINAVNNFRKKFGWAIKVLIPILLGVMLAVIVCIIVFSYAFEYMMFVLICLFAGFLIGSFPGITDEVKGEKITRKYALLIAAGALFVVALGVLNVIAGLNNFSVDNLFQPQPAWWLYLVLIPVGAVAAVALTVPGLSGSLILLILGFYRPLVDNVKHWAGEMFRGNFEHTLPLFGVLGCFAIGCLIGVVLVSKIMTVLLKKWRKETFFTIIGFISGSILVLFCNSNIVSYYRVWANPALGDAFKIHPIIPMWLEIIIGLLVLALCAFLSYRLVVAQKKERLWRSMMETKQYLNDMFNTTFQENPEKYFSCGGRFEVLGNHTDHNHGLCLAATCNLSVYAAVKKTNDKLVRILSEGYGYYEVDLNNLEKLMEEEGHPTALIRGIARQLSDNYKVGGFKAYIKTEIPKGAGVSSSAAFELLISKLFSALYNDNKIPLLELCKASQHAENFYYGKMSGLLDQIGVAYGGLSYIDFAEVTQPSVDKLDVNFSDYQFIVVNTGGDHASLSDLYDAIPKDMFKVADYFSKGFLREVNYKDILNNKNEIIEQCGLLPYQRAEHFLLENERVHKAYEALKLHNIPMLIKLMNESRESSTKLLQNMYVDKKAGSPLEACELIYKASNKKAGVKINGGGFAGSVIALVPKDEVTKVVKAAKDKYGKDNVYLVSIRNEEPSEF